MDPIEEILNRTLRSDVPASTAQHLHENSVAFLDRLVEDADPKANPPKCRVPLHEDDSFVRLRGPFRYALAAILALALVGFPSFWLISPRGGNHPAFGQVMEKLKSVKSFKAKTYWKRGDQETLWNEVFWNQPGLSRTESYDGTIQITDMKQQMALYLTPKDKEGLVLEVSDAFSELTTRFMRSLMTLDPNSAEFVETRVFEDGEVNVFRIIQKELDQEFVVWADTQTGLPVRIELDTGKAIGKPNEHIMITRDFQYNMELDDSLFSLVPPDGYEIQEYPGEILLPSEYSARDLLDWIKLAVDLNDGVFPSDLFSENPMVMIPSQLLNKLSELRVDERKTLEQQAMKAYSFVVKELNTNGGGWRYIGQNVVFGAPNEIVCWWWSGDKEVYHVIKADLTSKEIPKEFFKEPDGEQGTFQQIKLRNEDQIIVLQEIEFPPSQSRSHSRYLKNFGDKFLSVSFQQVKMGDATGGVTYICFPSEADAKEASANQMDWSMPYRLKTFGNFIVFVQLREEEEELEQFSAIVFRSIASRGLK